MSKDRGAGKRNVVAEHMEVTGDLRKFLLEQHESQEDDARHRVASSAEDVPATITFDDGYPPMAPTAGNKRLLAMYDRASRDIGAGGGGASAVDPSRAGAADVSFMAGIVPMIIPPS